MMKQRNLANSLLADDQREVFFSYHYTTLDLKYNGFGNYVGVFSTEAYAGQGKAKFILDAEKSIGMAVEEYLKSQGVDSKVQVKVLFFQ